MALPVLSARARFEALVGSAGRFLVVKGSTGSGKSTQLPQYLADMAMFAGLKILVTEPRKVAAMTLAARVALEWSAGEHAPPCGRAAVGYRAGGASSAGARIEFVTEGNFLAQLIRQSKGDGVLDGVGAVVLDEAHERSVKSDLILGALRSLPGLQHLRVVVASATMDTALFSTFLGGAPVIDVPGRVFPVDVVYRPTSEHEVDTVSKVVGMALEIHGGPPASGDVLAFLTGQADVLRACDMFSRAAKEASAITLPLFGNQDPGEQALVFAPAAGGRRKVIFSTKVAEMSLTIDGVRHVIDPGVCKESKPVAPGSSTLVLSMLPISKNAAEQRKGRAGRTAPGTCYRLYSQDEHAVMQQSSVAEVHRVPLTITAINILALGMDPATFQWLEAPSRSAVAAALSDLALLGAVVGDPRTLTLTLTPLGGLMAELQVEPEHARLIQHACAAGRAAVGATLVGLLSVSTILFWRGASEEDRKQAAVQHAKLAAKP
ncbi:P-loop containing nucleoside triphosphate hydrolase protein [Baffinella frigidus]|nr:P-loop containing nucleoside triphosphate hydrolase protein [Cryptophyta sp. CCMP2293]